MALSLPDPEKVGLEEECDAGDVGGNLSISEEAEEDGDTEGGVGDDDCDDETDDAPFFDRPVLLET